MVTKCVLSACKRRYKNDRSVKCHGFPKDAVTRRMWSLWVAERNGHYREYSASAMLCCKHFARTSYQLDVYGVDYTSKLRGDAVPSINPEPEEATEDDVGETGSPQQVEEMEAALPENAVQAEGDAAEGNVCAEVSSDHAGAEAALPENAVHAEGDAAEGNVCAEVNSDHADGDVPAASALMTPPRKSLLHRGRKVYVGDLSPRDYATPIRARHNLALAKSHLSEVRKRLHNTQGQLRRAKARIKTLEGLIKHLKDKIISAEMANMIEVKFDDRACNIVTLQDMEGDESWDSVFLGSEK